MRIGSKYWLKLKHIFPGEKICSNIMTKIQVTRPLKKGRVLCVLHHYETREIDKVTVSLKKKLIRKKAFKIHV